MTLDDPAGLARLYRDALLNDVVPFWLRHSPDRECGGYFWKGCFHVPRALLLCSQWLERGGAGAAPAPVNAGNA